MRTTLTLLMLVLLTGCNTNDENWQAAMKGFIAACDGKMTGEFYKSSGLGSSVTLKCDNLNTQKTVKAQ